MNKRTMYIFVALLAIILGACGQKGPLKLPNEKEQTPNEALFVG